MAGKTMKKNDKKEKRLSSAVKTENKKLGVVKCKITKNKTLSKSHKNVKKNWILIDAENAVLGRLSAFLVHRLNGKHLATYAPHTDDGDNIVVINCDKIKVSGNKETEKVYRSHSGFPGGMKEKTVREIREGKKPCDLLRITLSRMLGRCKLSCKLVSKNLYLYAGSEHKQNAQMPVAIKFSELNRKNII